jgi:hypothetical protein
MCTTGVSCMRPPGSVLYSAHNTTAAGHAFKALMFADDFTALATSMQELQNAVLINICHAWCTKWRMSANIGPKKSAYMAFAPECAKCTDASHKLCWQDMPIPRLEAYKYLGVVMHENCNWDAHVEYVKEKGTNATYAMASVLRNEHIQLAVRRIVLQACVRPVVEYGFSVWQGTKQQMAKIERVQYRVLKRMAGTYSKLSADILGMEFGCRSYTRSVDVEAIQAG